jgi:glycosyltransferase involved in cell wall biosynthesis
MTANGSQKGCADDRPLVSVIVPVYNGERHLRDALESILAQDYRPIEVIVVDDGSTDRSAEIVRQFSEIRLISQPNQGPAAARNRGILASRGSLIAFLDQDDLWVPGKLTKQLAYLGAHPEVRFVITMQQMFLEPGEARPYWLKPELLDQPGPGFMPSTLLSRRELFDSLGLFDASYSTSSDTDWFFRAKDRGVAMATIPEVLLHKRVHGGNQSFQSLTLNRELLRVARASIRKQAGTKEHGGDGVNNA